MRIEWFGMAAFRLDAEGKSVFIDPFGDVSGLQARGIEFNYPAIETSPVDLLLVTHEHADHNGVEAVPGDPVVLRSTAGKLESPLGEVVAIASEHDDQAGTMRGPNTIFVFDLDGVRVCHFGDFGQKALRDEQREAIGNIDLLFIPVGAGPTIGPEQATTIVDTLAPRWVVPMHYRTERVGFLELPDDFLNRAPHVETATETSVETGDLPEFPEPLVVQLATP
jgi:L-ascorbate metabolism protein UlaG (beta-lactamase superfamily)